MSSSSFLRVGPFAPLARFALVASGAGLMVLSSTAALASSAAASDQAKEYAEARKLAIKDPKVQAAFDKANEKLDERIVEIDPSLKPYVEKRHSAAQSTAKPTPAPAAKQPVAAAKKGEANSSSTTHVVTKGETLSSIALQYKVSVASLKSANQITDERKLRVGQKLVIPSSGAAAAAAPASSSTSGNSGASQGDTKSKPGFWDHLWNEF